MKINIEIKNVSLYYRKKTRDYVVSATFVSDNVCECINFSAKRENKAKKSFYRYCTRDGILAEEMLYLFKNNMIHIKKED